MPENEIQEAIKPEQIITTKESEDDTIDTVPFTDDVNDTVPIHIWYRCSQTKGWI